MTTLMERAFWDHLSQREKNFQIKISIFPKFSLGQASAVSGLSSSETDRILWDKRYFIHFDPESCYFYPHSQLRILLREQFDCLSPDMKKAIYLHGGKLAEQEHNRLNPLRFYYMAGAWERIFKIPLNSYELADIMRADIHPIVLDILSKSPEEVKLRHPQAVLSMAFCLFIIGKTQKLLELREKLEEMDQCMPVYYELTHSHGSGAELVMRAEAHLMWGEPDKAKPLCYQALFVASQYHQSSIYQCGLFVLCRIAFQQGNLPEMEALLASMREISDNHREELGRYTYDLASNYMAILQGRDEDVALWLSRGEITEKRLIIMVQTLAHIIFGRCLLLRKEYHKLLGVSQYFLNLSKVFPNLLTQVYIHIYCAVALRALE